MYTAKKLAFTSQSPAELWKSGLSFQPTVRPETVVSGDEGDSWVRTQDQRGAQASSGPCQLPRPSASGRGKRCFLAPRPRPAAPPRHRADKGARGGSARVRRRGTGLGHPEAQGPGQGTWQRPAHQKVPWKFHATRCGSGGRDHERVPNPRRPEPPPGHDLAPGEDLEVQELRG